MVPNYMNQYAKWTFTIRTLQVWIWSMRQRKGLVFRMSAICLLLPITTALRLAITIILATTTWCLTVNMVNWLRLYIIYHLINKITLYNIFRPLIAPTILFLHQKSIKISKRPFKAVLTGSLRVRKKKDLSKMTRIQNSFRRKVAFCNLNLRRTFKIVTSIICSVTSAIFLI